MERNELKVTAQEEQWKTAVYLCSHFAIRIYRRFSQNYLYVFELWFRFCSFEFKLYATGEGGGRERKSVFYWCNSVWFVFFFLLLVFYSFPIVRWRNKKRQWRQTSEFSHCLTPLKSLYTLQCTCVLFSVRPKWKIQHTKTRKFIRSVNF